jgi:hypothetical protein
MVEAFDRKTLTTTRISRGLSARQQLKGNAELIGLVHSMLVHDTKETWFVPIEGNNVT